MSQLVARTSAVLMAGLCLGLSATAWAQSQALPKGPAFDCSKASSPVERLICEDEGLGALDRRLDAVYKAAMGKARDDMPQRLRTEQRGWVKGREECSNAKGPGSPVYITESWTATDVRECVGANYQLRIAELQVMYQLVPAQKPVFFACNDNPANEVVAQFFETDPPAARFERGDRTVIGYLVKTASGAKYEGQNLSFWNRGNEATVVWSGEELTCKVR